MTKWILRAVTGIVVLLLLALSFGWSVLALPYFSGFRSTLVSKVLSEQIGQPLLVNGDVSVVLGRTSTVRAAGVQIPSENMPDVDLAKLDNFEFDVNLVALLDRRIDLNNLIVDGLQVNLLIQEDGVTSFSERERTTIKTSQGAPEQPSEEDETQQVDSDSTDEGGLLAFLKTRTAAFTDIALVIDDAITGFEFEFSLEEFSLNQLDGGSTLQVLSNGSVNGQPFVLEGNYPEAAPFTTIAEFSSVQLSFNGEPLPPEAGSGYTGALSLEVAGVGDLLDVLKLERSLEGEGRVTADISHQSGVTAMSNVEVNVLLEKGQLISVAGNIDNLGELQGVDIQLLARLHPENQPPPRPKDFADIKLTGIETQIKNENGALELVSLNLSTNIIEQGLDKVGPVTIEHIRRTPDGTLALQGLSVQAGPIDAPILLVQGDINDVLQLRDFELNGEIDAPASLVLTSLDDDVAAKFGGVEAEFEFFEADGALALKKLDARSVDSDVWELQASAEVGDVKSINGVSVDLNFGIASGTEFLTALQLQPIDTGAFGFDVALRGEEEHVDLGLELQSGESLIESTISITEEAGRPMLRGSVISESLVLSDIQNAIAALTELGKMGEQSDTTEEPDNAEGVNDVPLQPLVLPESVPENGAENNDAVAQNTEEGKAAPSGGDHLLNLDEILRESDIYGTVEFREILGIDGLTSVSGELVSEGGKARLGPLEFAYGGGYFNFEANADVIEAPQYVSIAGATSGWTLSEILTSAGVDFDADGNLSGRFNLAGNLSSVDSFLNSMSGTATIEMLDGRVTTSLLELAGLGIFPWLFSDELRQGYTDVVCIIVPVNVNGQAVSFDSLVAETASVQLVAKGSVDIKGDAISIRAEPRPVGKPLARSAWPFDVSGKLSEPRFKLDIGGSRSVRADGADAIPADRTPCQPDILQLE